MLFSAILFSSLDLYLCFVDVDQRQFPAYEHVFFFCILSFIDLLTQGLLLGYIFTCLQGVIISLQKATYEQNSISHFIQVLARVFKNIPIVQS